MCFSVRFRLRDRAMEAVIRWLWVSPMCEIFLSGRVIRSTWHLVQLQPRYVISVADGNWFLLKLLAFESGQNFPCPTLGIYLDRTFNVLDSWRPVSYIWSTSIGAVTDGMQLLQAHQCRRPQRKHAVPWRAEGLPQLRARGRADLRPRIRARRITPRQTRFDAMPTCESVG